MSETKYTPGPWRVGSETGHNANHVFGSDGEGICMVYGIAQNWTLDRCQAEPGMPNARLIAVAPEMLAELERLEDILGDQCDFGVMDGHPAYRSWVRVRDLIAKAKDTTTPEAPPP